MKGTSEYGPTLLRLVLGVMILVMGIKKLLNPEMIIGFLGSLGFPVPIFFGWLLLLSEIVFGAAVLIGWKVRYTVWPLLVVLVVATVLVILPASGQDQLNLLFHILAIAALISLSLTGPGALSVSKES